MGSYQFEGRSQFRFKSKEVCTILILKIFFVCVFYLFVFFLFFVFGQLGRPMCYEGFAVNICLEIISNTIHSLMQFPNV